MHQTASDKKEKANESYDSKHELTLYPRPSGKVTTEGEAQAKLGVQNKTCIKELANISVLVHLHFVK